MHDSRGALYLLIVSAIVIGLVAGNWLEWRRAVTVASNWFFLVYLGLALTRLDRLTEGHLRRAAIRSDAPTYVIFLIALGTVAAALVSLFLAVNAGAGRSSLWLGLALISVPLGWATIHMMAAFHYAHLYWRPGASVAAAAPGAVAATSATGGSQPGLVFPGGRTPDGWDFVYFSFVIGVAAQTSDVTIASRRIRRFALVHSTIAFFFNTVLVAAAVNVAVAGG